MQSCRPETVLPAASRLRSAKDFGATLRGGVRVGRGTLVVHARALPVAGQHSRVGFVVSKRVGNAVTRNRVKRRLRHLARAQLIDSPAGLQVVVRALPAAATEPHRLGAEFVAAWWGCLAKLGANSR